MSVLSPSFGIAAALRGEIITALKAHTAPETLNAIIAPSLSMINQWATQIPLLLNQSNCIDLIFALRKDLFTGPSFTQTTFSTSVADSPEAFQVFLGLTRELMTAQRNEKGSKVRFLLYFSFQSFLVSYMSVLACALYQIQADYRR